jgi:protein phosphatase 1L
MEDFHIAEFRDIDGEETGLFGIIDSHGGPAVGKHVQHHLFNNILSEGGVHLDPAGATRDGYLLTDRNVLESSLEGGCSAVTAMLVDHGSRLIVANVGDARAVLAKNGRAVQLSVDHDPGSPTERASVERRGGMVTQIPGDYWRVDGLLSVARAFGDKSLKEHMSARPDLADHVVDLSCEFLILGSNGLWAVFTNQEIVDIVHKIKDPTKAAQELVSEARNRHSEDDISCLVIQFREL